MDNCFTSRVICWLYVRNVLLYFSPRITTYVLKILFYKVYKMMVHTVAIPLVTTWVGSSCQIIYIKFEHNAIVQHPYGGIQQLRGPNFIQFWPPTLLEWIIVDILYRAPFIWYIFFVHVTKLGFSTDPPTHLFLFTYLLNDPYEAQLVLDGQGIKSLLCLGVMTSIFLHSSLPKLTIYWEALA